MKQTDCTDEAKTSPSCVCVFVCGGGGGEREGGNGRGKREGETGGGEREGSGGQD